MFSEVPSIQETSPALNVLDRAWIRYHEMVTQTIDFQDLILHKMGTNKAYSQPELLVKNKAISASALSRNLSASMKKQTMYLVTLALFPNRLLFG